MRKATLVATLTLTLAALGSLFALAAAKPNEKDEQERKIKESEVPPPALAALKKLAGTATITQFEEEIEHGDTFYEGSWKQASGKVDALVTAAGDLVEIEEIVPADAVPKVVLNAAQKAAGATAGLRFEKKTTVLYEVKFRKNDRRHEVVFSPTGREHGHEESTGTEDDD